MGASPVSAGTCRTPWWRPARRSGTEWCREARGLPPERASRRLAVAVLPGPGPGSRGRMEPSPSSRRLPWMKSRWIHCLYPEGLNPQDQAMLVPVQSRAARQCGRRRRRVSCGIASTGSPPDKSPFRSPFQSRNTLDINRCYYTISDSHQSTYNTLRDISGTLWTLQRGMVPSSSPAQSRKLERKPCGTAAIPCSRSSHRSCLSSSGFPCPRVNTKGPAPSPSVRAASRISRGAATERHPVLAVRLRPPGRDGPYTSVPIDLRPLGPPHLAPPGRRQHQELEGQLRGWQCRRSPHRPDGRSHFSMR